MKRSTTEEERSLFLAALSGRMPAKRPRAKAKRKSVKAEKPVRKETKESAHVPYKPGHRHATPQEEELFRMTIAGHAPVKQPSSAPKAKAEKPSPPAKPQKTGVDGNTLRRLTRGELAPGAKLDLHGMTEAAAHGALTAFMLAAHRRGDRLVLVVTGKGSGGPGVLKQMVPRWLDEAPMAKIIAEKRWAHRRHGGEGALYVYLRKLVRH
jgi:DNA-nicking Smr family endonuclease